MGRSRIAWAGSAAAPWAIALGLLVSITAQADQDPGSAGVSHYPSHFFGADNAPPSLIEARYVVGSAEDLAAIPDEVEPKATFKPDRNVLPEINRQAKGDPFVPLRPGFEARAHRPADADARAEADWPAAGRSPAASEAVKSAAPAIVYGDGATPGLPLEIALNSATPRPSETKVIVRPRGARMAAAPALPAPAPPQQPGVIHVLEETGKPNYASLIDSKDATRQMRCLAEAIYFESRSEPEAGQAAVAQVVLNRVRSGIFPTDVCGVVYQDAKRPFACQFSFACEGKSLRIEEPGAWATATRIAEEVVRGASYDPKLVDAVNYHANYVYPFWAPSLRRVERIGAHLFYAMKPGLYWAPGALNGRGDLPPAAAPQQQASK
jgi:spore germination cell wall hydrolase CwlJ-like protein